MKLVDRERVDGIQVTIGHRVYYRNGKQRVSRRYAAEYRDSDGRQVCRGLGVTSRAKARRMAVEIQQELESGIERVLETNLHITDLVKTYFQAVQTKGVAPKTEWKYRTDLKKLEQYCMEHKLRFARRFSENDLYSYRKWMKEQGYAEKTVEAAVVLAKQMFKWAWRQKLVKEYKLAGVSFPKAKTGPQPCFTSEQVDNLIEAGKDEERLACALMGYGGLRIGEVEQLCWEDIMRKDNQFTMIHVRRGGSNGTTKDKDERFVPVHPVVSELLGPRKKNNGPIFKNTTERRLLKRVKKLCEECGFDNPRKYKLHSFRHHFASLCANHHVAFRKALAWLGHSSSEMLDLYYHLHDEESRNAMQALAENTQHQTVNDNQNSPFEGNLRAIGQSKIEKTLQVPEVQELVKALSDITERGGFEPPVPQGAHRFSKPAR
jgi:site-specific recombinase XerD